MIASCSLIMIQNISGGFVYMVKCTFWSTSGNSSVLMDKQRVYNMAVWGYETSLDVWENIFQDQ